MNPIVFAMRRPFTVMVLVVAVALGSLLAVTRMAIDIFPNLRSARSCARLPFSPVGLASPAPRRSAGVWGRIDRTSSRCCPR